MKLWIFNNYNTLPEHGQFTRSFNFGKNLKEMGHEPVVFAGSHPHNSDVQLIEGPERFRVFQEEPFPWVLVKTAKYGKSRKKQVLTMFQFYRNGKKAAKWAAERYGKPDAVLGSSAHPLAALLAVRLGKRFGCRSVVEIRDLWPESIVAYGIAGPRNPAVIALRWLEKWLYVHADAVIMTWPGGYDYIREMGWERQIPAGKVFHISNGVDRKAFAENRESRQIADADLDNGEKFRAVYAGSIRKVNDLRLLVDAAEILARRGNRRVLILVWGDGDQRETLEALAREKGLENIRFKGRVEKDAVPYILSRADVTILHNRRSKLDKYGQSQNKFFEYLAAGKPILMTYSVGYSVCRARNCGIELEEQTPEAVADALEQLSGLSEDDYQTYAKNAAAAAEEYDFQNLTQKLIGVLEAL